jgi:hypothetical protein
MAIGFVGSKIVLYLNGELFAPDWLKMAQWFWKKSPKCRKVAGRLTVSK